MNAGILSGVLECVIYCRISRDREGAGVGVARQERECRELAVALGKTVRERGIYVDNDISASDRRKVRRDYRRLLADLKDDPADIVVWHTDRLHRRPAELEEYIDFANAAGITTHAVRAGQIDLTTPSGRLNARNLGAAASYEAEHMAERQRASKAEAVAAGRHLGGRRSFGYSADGKSLCHGEVIAGEEEAARRGLEGPPAETRSGVRRRIVLPYDEAAELRDAAAALLSGRSAASIARDWNARGILTSTGHAWAPREVAKAVAKPRNAGLLEHKGKIAGPGNWPAILDEVTWRRLRALLADPARRTTPGGARRHLGSGLYVCGVCGLTVLASTSTGRRLVYRCRSRAHVARDAASVDAHVRRLMTRYLSGPELVARLAAMAAESPQPSAAAAELESVRGELDGLAVLADEGKITARQLGIASARLLGRQSALESAIADSVRTLPGPVPSGARWELMAGDVEAEQAAIAAVMTVTILPGTRGRVAGWHAGQSYFDPDAIAIEWKQPGR